MDMGVKQSRGRKGTNRQEGEGKRREGRWGTRWMYGSLLRSHNKHHTQWIYTMKTSTTFFWHGNSLFCFVCVFLCINMSVCIQVEARGQHWIPSLMTQHFIFWDRVSSWIWRLQTLIVDWPTTPRILLSLPSQHIDHRQGPLPGPHMATKDLQFSHLWGQHSAISPAPLFLACVMCKDCYDRKFTNKEQEKCVQSLFCSCPVWKRKQDPINRTKYVIALS